LERDGHTEATVDLAKLAGFSPSGVLCEIVSEKEGEGVGEMMRLPEMTKWCEREKIVLTSIVDLQAFVKERGGLEPITDNE